MHLTRPITAQIEITDHCNFRCKHCYLLDSTNLHSFPEPNDQKVLKIAEILCNEGVFNIILTGGEPMTTPNLLKQMVDYLSSRNINVSINTNLSLLTDELIQFLIEKDIRNLLISCPSATPTLYEEITNYHHFDYFWGNLRKVINSGLNYSLNMVVSQYNKHNVIDTAKKLKELGVYKFGATPMSLNPLYPRKDLLLSNEEVRILTKDLLWIKDNLGMSIDIMEALPKCVFPKELLNKDLAFLKRRCQAGLSIIAVSSNGDVRPCTHNSDVYGNILNECLEDIWKRMAPWRTMELIPSKCKVCKYFVSCHGGCRVNAKTYHGKWDAEDVWTEYPICENLLLNKPIELDFDMPVRVTSLKSRTEGTHILVCGNNSSQVAVINEEGYRLLDFIREHEIITLREIAHLNNTSVEDKTFIDIVSYLIKRKIISYILKPNMF